MGTPHLESLDYGGEVMSKKIFVLDTNVPLADPHAFFAFEENEVVIPAIVLEEIDSKKRNQDELGRNARQASRLLDELRLQGPLNEPVTLPSGGSIRVEMNHKSFEKLQNTFGEASNDNRIIAVALNLHREEQEKGEHAKPVILVSKDTLVRIKADVLGIIAQDYFKERVLQDIELFKGHQMVETNTAIINTFYETKQLHTEPLQINTHPNEYIVLKDNQGNNQSALTQVNSENTKLHPLYHYKEQPVWGISARNLQQKMALDLLLNDDIKLVTLVGEAGTGKTLISLAAGLLKVEEEQRYKKLLIARPVVPMGKDIGYLPGDKEEKLRPWMQPIYDNLEYLFETKKSEDLDRILAGMGSIQVEALTYIRGRSIPGQYIIIDEAQNLSKHEVKTIISRVGEGSKIVLLGDHWQIDHPYLSPENNGLTHAVVAFKEQPIAGHVTLTKGERSELATLAASLL